MANVDERLQQCAASADAMLDLAETPRQQTDQRRVQQFAIALHRHAKGVKAAVAAWRQEIRHQT